VNFRRVGGSIRQQNRRDAFAFAPATDTVLFAETRHFKNALVDRDRLHRGDVTDHGEVHIRSACQHITAGTTCDRCST